MSDRPAYDELPELGTRGVRTAWAVPGYADGSITLLTPERVAAAAALVRTGQVVTLNLAIDAFDPPLFGREAVRHEVIAPARNEREDTLNGFNPQSSSQWDGLGHVRAREHGFFTGLTDDDAARTRLGIERWARHGIVGRGVLLDVARHFGALTGAPLDPFAGTAILPGQLTATAARQGVTLQPGDIVCVRTGWSGEFLRRQRTPNPAASTAWAGLHAGEATARLVWDGQFAALCCDNPAVECAPGDPAAGSLHRRLLPGLGIALAELLDLDGLAAACAQARRYEFQFVAAPLPIRGGVSSPSNALAIL
jgi:hypothetical protein